jgi:hypothetical protein
MQACGCGVTIKSCQTAEVSNPSGRQLTARDGQKGNRLAFSLASLTARGWHEERAEIFEFSHFHTAPQILRRRLARTAPNRLYYAEEGVAYGAGAQED